MIFCYVWLKIWIRFKELSHDFLHQDCSRHVGEHFPSVISMPKESI
jgi:hypothetical protein